jgi:Peptidase family C25
MQGSVRTLFTRIAPTLALVSAAVVFPAAAFGADTTPLEQQWQLAGGKAVKIVVRRDGWYRASRKSLTAAGLPRDAQAKTYRLYTDGREVPIRVRPDRSIEFFGIARYLPSTGSRTYWLVWAGDRGKRIKRASLGARRGQRPQTFTSTVVSRPRNVFFAFLKGGPADSFFGPSLTPGKPVSLTLSVPAPAPGSASLDVAVQGISLRPHQVSVAFNGNAVATASFDNRDPGHATARLAADAVKAGDNTVTLAAGAGDLDFSILWQVRLTYQRLFQANGDRLLFRLGKRRVARVSGFTTPQVTVIDITRPNEPRFVRATTRRTGGSYTLTVRASARARNLLAVGRSAVLEPAAVLPEQPSNWHRADLGADVIVIANGDLIPSLGPLVALRESQGLQVKVVDVADLYDEFDYGIHGANAIRSFLQRAYETWRPRPRFVLLVGDASYDPRNYLGKGGHDLVPSGMLDLGVTKAPSDVWLADFDNDGKPELAVGRLPVMTRAEADGLVAKIVAYDQQPAPPAPRALFVSDSDPRIPLEQQADLLQPLVPSSMTVEKVYRRDAPDLNAYKQTLRDALQTGPTIVDFVGHGGPEVWGREGFFFLSDARQLTNAHPSVYVATSCLNAWFFDPDPAHDSLGEALVEQPVGGAVAMLSSSGLETVTDGAALNAEFLRTLMGQGSPTIGEAAAAAQRSVGGDLARAAILFGDPATRLR